MTKENTELLFLFQTFKIDFQSLSDWANRKMVCYNLSKLQSNI